MLGIKLIISLIVLCFISCNSQKSQDDYDVYLLIGQSNMAGRGTLTEQDKSNVIENVWILNAQGKPEPAIAPLNRYSTIRKSLKMQGMNPGYEFSKTLSKKTGRKILLVCNARGGTSLSQWMPEAQADTLIASQNFFNETVARAKTAMQYGTLKAILWHQGESNSARPEDYLTHLSVMVSQLRNKLGDTQNAIPFVAGEIAPWHKNKDKFNPIINQISTIVPNSACVSSAECTWLKNEKDPHFSRDGQILLGKRYAEIIYEILYENK